MNVSQRIIVGLSLTRPWEFAFAHGKRVENRSWRPAGKYRGCYIALHSAKSWSDDDREFISKTLNMPVPDKASCPHSQIFAVARWMGEIILPEPEHVRLLGLDTRDLEGPGIPLLPDQERWFIGPYGWLLRDYIKLPEPILCGGAQKLWEVPADVLIRVREQYRAAKMVA